MKWCLWLLLVVVGLSEVAHFTRGFPDGAPRNRKLCRTLKPRHEGEYPQQSDAPYSVVPAKTKIAVGESVNVTLSANAGTNFKGFVMQARPRMIANYIKPIGTFQILDSSHSKTIDCLSSTENTVTHSNADDKTSISFMWTPPSGYKGKAFFRASFVKTYSIFWVNVSSSIDVGNVTETNEIDSDFENSIFVNREIYEKCGVTKACFGIPENCVSDGSCDVLAAVSVRGSKFEFELMGEHVKFVSVSLSESGRVNTESLMTCALVNNKVKLRQLSYYEHQNDEFLWNRNEALINSSYVDGILYCKFEKNQNMEVNSVYYDLKNTRYFLALAAGNNEMENDNIDFKKVRFHISPKNNYLTDVSGFSTSINKKNASKQKYWYQIWFFSVFEYFYPLH